MKRIFLLSLWLSLPASADFAARAPLELSGSGPLYRVALPIEAYRDARRDLADVRVLNARGEPVPIALAGDPDREKEAPATVELPQFAVSSVRPGVNAGTEVTIRASDGMLVAVKGRGAARPEVRPSAYLLDASAVKDPLRALVFQWDAAPGREVVPVRVEESDDLRSWRGVTSDSLLRLEQGGRVLEQPRAGFAPRRAKYYRVTWDGEAFALSSVRGELEARVKPLARSVLTVKGAPGAKPGEFVFDMGAQLPVEAVRIIPGEVNSAASYVLEARSARDEPPRGIASGSFYRIVRDGVELVSPPQEIGRRAARYWTLRLDAERAGLGSTPPTLEAHWRGAQVVFLARGDGPFVLAVGDPAAKPATVAVSTLIPGYERLDEMKLPEAKPKAWERTEPTRWPLPAFLADVPPRRLALWAILIAAVGVLAFMAWRLARQAGGTR